MFISNIVPRHVNHFSVILRKKNFQSYFSCCASSAESVPLLSAGGVSSAGLSVLCQCTLHTCALAATADWQVWWCNALT